MINLDGWKEVRNTTFSSTPQTQTKINVADTAPFSVGDQIAVFYKGEPENVGGRSGTISAVSGNTVTLEDVLLDTDAEIASIYTTAAIRKTPDVNVSMVVNAVQTTDFTTIGQLFVCSAPGVLSVLNPGTDGQVLTCSGSVAGGMYWATV